MKHKGIIVWLTVFILLAFLVTSATGKSLRPINKYGLKVIKALAKDPAIVMAAQKNSVLHENSAASLKLRGAMKGNAEALFAYVLNKDGKVVAASSNIGEQDFTKKFFFTIPIQFDAGTIYISDPINVYYFSLPVVAGNETVGVISVAISSENLLK